MSTEPKSKLEGAVLSLNTQRGALEQALAEFDASTKRAVGFIDKHMKRGADPNAFTPEQRIDDFKRAAAEFNTGGKGISKTVRDHVAELLLQAEALQEVAQAPPRPTKSSLETVDSPSHAAAVEAKADTAPEQSATATPSPAQAGGSEDVTKAVESATAPLQAQIISLRGELDVSKQRCQQIENSYRHLQQSYQSEKEHLDKMITSLKADVDAREKATVAVTRELQMVQSAAESDKREYEEAVTLKRQLEQRLEFAEKKRECDFTTFEHAMRDHEKDIHLWQSKYSDAMSRITRLNKEKENLQHRVVDEQLREHIRVLQRENNKLREERISALHDSISGGPCGTTTSFAGPNGSFSKVASASAVLTAALQDTIASLERDKAFMANQLDQAHRLLSQKDVDLVAAESKHVEERQQCLKEIGDLERRLRFFELKRSEDKLSMIGDRLDPLMGQRARHAKTAPCDRAALECYDDDSERAVEIHLDDILGEEPNTGDVDRRIQTVCNEMCQVCCFAHLRNASAAGAAKQPEKVESWERATQAEDYGRQELEREVLELRQTVDDLHRDVDRLRSDDKKQRSELQEKLLQQMRGFESQVDQIEKESKVRAFKLQKAQQTNEQLESLTQEQRATIQKLEKEISERESGARDAERKYMSLEMEKEELVTKVRVLRREIENLRDSALDAAVVRQSEAASLPQTLSQLANASSPGSRSTTTTNTPRESSAPQQQQQPTSSSSLRLQRIDAIKKLDNVLLNLHHQSVALDNEEQQIATEHDTSRQKRIERIEYLNASKPLWEREASRKGAGGVMKGPNGEAPDVVLLQMDREVEALRAEDADAEHRMQKYFIGIHKKRDQVLDATNKIIEKRNMLFEAMSSKK